MRLIFVLLASFLFSLSSALAQSAADPVNDVPTAAPFALMMDFETGAVLFSKNGDAPMAPASMAKLMTVAILFEKLKHNELRLDDTFTVTERAWRLSVAGKNESSKMFVSIGSQIRVEDLLRGIIIQSGNDACTVVAEHFAGSEEAFSDLMNAEAKKIGLKNSVFKNASGLPHPDMHVTSHDLALLAAYIIREFPQYYRMFAEREFTWNGIKQGNRNLLLGSYVGADGLKTGHTAASGYGMVASAQREGRRLILVVNGLASEAGRVAETKRLLDIGFREFRVYALLKPESSVGEVEVWSGEESKVSLVVQKPVTLLLRRTQRDALKVVLTYDTPVLAPVVKGQVIGKLTITAPGIESLSATVHAGANVDSGGLMTKMKLGLQELFSSEREPTQVSEQLTLPESQTAETAGP